MGCKTSENGGAGVPAGYKFCDERGTDKQAREKTGKKILAVLTQRRKNRKGPIEPAKLLQKLERAGFESLYVREQFWHLLSMDQIVFTSDRKVALPKRN